MLAFDERERLRKSERVIYNALLIGGLLFVIGLQILGLPMLWIILFLGILWVASNAFQTQIRKTYIVLFPSLKTLVEYEQKKYVGVAWWKKPNRVIEDIICIFSILTMFRSTYPKENLFFLGITVVAIISSNISRYIRIREIGG